MAMEGRQHLYEGYALKEITLPVRIMKALGADLLVVSNACGGLNPAYAKGDLMLIDNYRVALFQSGPTSRAMKPLGCRPKREP